jgi:glycosyltransferase involved in cell wall biosynthesis
MGTSEVPNKTIILHYTSPSVPGGVEIAIRNLLRHASDRSLPVQLVFGKGEPVDLKHITSTKVPLVDASNGETTKAHAILSRTGSLEPAIELAERLKRDLDSLVDDNTMLHVHNVINNTFNLPLVIALHDLLSNKPGLKLAAWAWDPVWVTEAGSGIDFSRYPYCLLKQQWPRTHYFALSPGRKLEIDRALHIQRKNRASLVLPYIDVCRVLGASETARKLITSENLLSADLVLIYPCRFSRRKRIEFAIEVIACLLGMHIQAKLVLCSFLSPHRPQQSQLYASEMRQLVQALGVGEAICFACDMKSDDVGSLTRLCDVFLSSAIDEGYGLAMVEALISGVPVVAMEECTRAINDSLLTTYPRSASPAEVADLIVAVSSDRRNRRRQLEKLAPNNYLERLTASLEEMTTESSQ